MGEGPTREDGDVGTWNRRSGCSLRVEGGSYLTVEGGEVQKRRRRPKHVHVGQGKMSHGLKTTRKSRVQFI